MTKTAPKHLAPETQKWWRSVVSEWALDPHHVRLLTMCAEAWDRCNQARETLAREGTTYQDRFGAPRMRPEVAIERDSRTAFMRALRELDLDDTTPEVKRPPALHSNRPLAAIRGGKPHAA